MYNWHNSLGQSADIAVNDDDLYPLAEQGWHAKTLVQDNRSAENL